MLWATSSHTMGLYVPHCDSTKIQKECSSFKAFGETLLISWKLAKQYDTEIIKGNVWKDHIHMIVRIAPKYSVAQTVWRLKGKLAITLYNTHAKKKQISQKSFWSRWYFVSTVWIDLEVIKKYVEDQWKQDQKFDSNQLDFSWQQDMIHSIECPASLAPSHGLAAS